MKTKENILGILLEMPDDKLLKLWNKYQKAIDGDRIIYNMSDFNQVVKDRNLTPADLVNKVSSFDTGDSYFVVKESGSFSSAFTVYELMLPAQIIDFWIDTDATTGVPEIDNLIIMGKQFQWIFVLNYGTYQKVETWTGNSETIEKNLVKRIKTDLLTKTGRKEALKVSKDVEIGEMPNIEKTFESVKQPPKVLSAKSAIEGVPVSFNLYRLDCI